MASFTRRHAAMAALLLVILLASATPPARAQEARLVWARVPGIPENVTLNDVFMLDTANAWAVGQSGAEDRGFVYRLMLEGGRWRAVEDLAAAQPLHAVVALDAQRVTAVGNAGTILTRDARGRWAGAGLNAPRLQLRELILFDATAGWALGYRVDVDGQFQAAALRLADGRWGEAAIERPTGVSFVNAAHFAPGAGRAVGSHVWRLEGGSWRIERGPEFCRSVNCNVELTAVRVLDAERAWLVGGFRSSCAICEDKAVIGVRVAGGWMNSFPSAPAVESIAPIGPGYDSNMLHGLYFLGDSEGLVVGFRRYLLQDGSGTYTADAFALRYRGGSWRYEQMLPRTNAVPLAVFMADATRALAVGSGGLLMSYGYGPQGDMPPTLGNPAQPMPNPNLPGVAFFPETGHTLRGAFLRYWQQNGGLARFGYPLSEEFAEVSSEDGRSYNVQYFERARFEYHPEFAGTQYEVLLGLLGHWVTAERKAEAPFQATGPTGEPGSVYFPETGFSMAPEFVGYWQRNGGLPIFGYPISAPFSELNAADGKSYLVQYFERNRFEYHPEFAGTQYEVLLGLLGSEYLVAKGWR